MYYSIIIIGAGHAGVEAAWITSKKKIKTLLITNNIDNIGNLSCNPSIGGIGKSHLITELNSLGGLMGKLADKSGIQYKIINTSKGEAVKSIRIQIDRLKYKNYTNKLLKLQNNLTIIQDTVKLLLIKNNIIKGVKTNNMIYYSEIVIITTGTFLNGKIYIGTKNSSGGRLNDFTNNSLANQLREFNSYGGRMKTGTPPRLLKSSINFNILKKQKGDINPIPNFSNIMSNKIHIKQKFCWLTKTNDKTHEIIKNSFIKSPLFNKNLTGISPRYCPSIEDKIYKFYKKPYHNIFLEPEGNSSNEYYPNGISTSLPYIIQEKFIKSIKGLENCKITRPGYGVEYDFFNPKNLKISLESKIVRNLFFAGQINGTTGYEEAAVQGLLAGLYSISIIKNENFKFLKKNFSYISLMINELTSYGVTEPYRIFTSKSNNQLILRKDTSDDRFININKLVKIDKNHINKILHYKFIFKKKLKNQINFSLLNIINENTLQKLKLKLHIYWKYKNYIKLKNKNNLINYNLKLNIKNYFDIKNISNEISEKLNKIKPKKFKDLKNINKSTLKILFKKFY